MTRKRPSLTKQIILMLSSALIPIIILSIILSGMLVNTLQDELFTAYETEMRLYMQSLDNNQRTIERDLNSAVSDNWMFFSQTSSDTDIERMTMFMRLRDIRITYSEFIRCIFIIEDVPDTEVLLSYDDDMYTYDDSQIIKEYLHDLDISTMSNRAYEPHVIDQVSYLLFSVKNYKQNVLIGYLVRLQDILPVYGKNDENGFLLQWQDERIYTADSTIDESLIEGADVFGNVYSNKINTVSVTSADGRYAFMKIIDRNRIFGQLPMLQRSLVIVAFLMILLIPAVWYFMRKRVLQPLDRLRAAMQEVENDHIEFRMQEETSSQDFNYIQQEFNAMADEIQNLRIQAYEREIEKLQIEADNLRLQVSPHMLMNSLNMIYNLSLSRNNKVIQQFTLCLSDYFRYSLKNHELTVPLSEELRFVESYVNVQKVRFPGKFIYVYDIDEETMEVKIPPLLIQNFVENTIKYGLKMDSEIEIILTVKADADKIYISIVDTGAGMSKDVLEHLRSGESFEDNNGTHIGIWNCRRRLHMLYADAAVLNITSAPEEGTQVWIEIPQQVTQSAEAAAFG